MKCCKEPSEPVKVRIKVGAPVMQDHGFGRWPATASGEDVDPDMVFDGTWCGRYWDCRAYGFGVIDGGFASYGNGSILVTGRESCEVVDVVDISRNDS